MSKFFNFNDLAWFTRKKRFYFLAVPAIIISFFLINPHSAKAASGGRIGGGSFQSPSIPQTKSYGGYGNSYRGGGIGFPFLLPIFGFGGSGIFGFLILMSIVGVIVNSIKNSSNLNGPRNTEIITQTTNPSQVSLIQLQLGLLASAKEIQSNLRDLASSSNTSTPLGLQKVLQDTTLSLLRKPELWVYSNLETGSVPFSFAESTFNRISITERSKLQAEVTSNFSGQISTSKNPEFKSGDSNSTNEYIAITIIVATKKDLRIIGYENSSQITEVLKILGSIASTDLMALEIIWQPEGEGEALSHEELITQYPNLKHL